jgi:hypothetical protein
LQEFDKKEFIHNILFKYVISLQQASDHIFCKPIFRSTMKKDRSNKSYARGAPIPPPVLEQRCLPAT